MFIITGRSWVEGPDNIPLLAKSFVAHLLMVHAFFPSFFYTINNPLWTLTLEFSFYLTFPLLIWFSRRYSVLACFFTLLTLSVAIDLSLQYLKFHELIGGNIVFVVRKSFLVRWPEFASGMLAAHFIVRRMIASNQSAKKTVLDSRVLLFSSAVILFFLALVTSNYSSRYPVLVAGKESIFGLAALCLLMAASISVQPTANWIRSVLENKFLVKMGVISYSFYLIHQPLLKLALASPGVRSLNSTNRLLVCTSVVFIVITVLALCFYKFIEKPFATSRGRTRQQNA